MKMAGKSVTLRMGNEELEIIESYLLEHPGQNVSDFIRNAILAQGSVENGIFVRLNEVQMNTLAGMKEIGTIFSEEEFARKCIMDAIISNEDIQESASRSFKNAQLAKQMR